MKSKWMKNLLRLLITLLGAGVGVAVTVACLQLFEMAQLNDRIPLWVLVAGYAGMGLLGAGVFYALSNRMISDFASMGLKFERRLNEMSLGQLMSCTTGLVCGLLIAALLSQILRFMGNSMFTTIMAAIFFLIFGMMGFTIGKHRAGEVDTVVKRVTAPQLRRFVRKRKLHTEQKRAAQPAKLLDTSALIDGRILDVCKTGFIEGVLMVPEFVLTELRHVADSTDAQRRVKGRRGLEILGQLEQNAPVEIISDDFADTGEVDVKLLRLSQKRGAAVITGDYNLCRAAKAMGARALNLNELAGALRPAVLPGEEMCVTVAREGKEPGQGVAYLEDGTMMVIEGGKKKLGEEIIAVVTTALQTSAGRMIFAKIKEV